MYRIVEHQADLAIGLEAADRQGLFRSALEAVVELLTGDALHHPSETDADAQIGVSSITSEGFDDEERLVGLLNEMLYLCQVKNLLPVEIGDITFQGVSVSAQVSGYPGRGLSRFVRDIKAATYHNLSIKKDNLWSAALIFDV